MLLIQHAIYPYRRPLFERLADEVDLTVLFAIHSKSFRQWDTSEMLEHAPFNARVLSHIRLGPLVFNRGLIQELREGRFDVIVLGVIDLITLPQVIVLLIASRLMRVPIVVCEEFFPTPWYVRSRPLLARLAIATRRFVYRRTSAFSTWNLNARAFLIACGAPEDRVFAGPHAYPPPPPREPIGDAGDNIFVSIAYFLPRKGLDVLIRAFKELRGDARLVIAGSGECESALRAEARGDDRISFVGYLDSDEKAELLSRAYALVLPTLWDPWGLVVNEAFSYGVPAVLTDAAGVAASASGAALVVPAGDQSALRNALQRLLDEQGLRASLAAHAKPLVAEWTVDAQAAPLLAAVDAAIRTRRSSHVRENASTADA